MKQASPLVGGYAAAAACLGLVLALAGCGDSPEPAPPAAQPPVQAAEVPASAAASSAAWTQFAATLPADDRATALDVNRVTPPTSETEAPQRL